MQNKPKSIDNLNLQNRINELNNIYELHQVFDSNAFKVIARYYTNSGYAKGNERITKLLKENKFSRKEFEQDPVKNIVDFLRGYFIDRGGNLLEV